MWYQKYFDWTFLSWAVDNGCHRYQYFEERCWWDNQIIYFHRNRKERNLNFTENIGLSENWATCNAEAQPQANLYLAITQAPLRRVKFLTKRHQHSSLSRNGPLQSLNIVYILPILLQHFFFKISLLQWFDV